MGITPGFYLSTLEQVALDEGFFTKNGLNVTLVPLGGSPLETTSLSNGSIDVMTSTADGALGLLQKAGLLSNAQVVVGQTKIFFDIGANNTVPQPASSSPADVMALLKGHTVLVSGFGSPYYLTVGALNTVNIPLSAVHFANVTHGPPQVAALENNSGQFVISDAQDMASILAAKKGRVLLSYSDPGVLPSYLSGVEDGALWAKKSYVSSNPTAIARLQKAFAQADEWSHQSSNLTAYEAELKKVVGTAVPDAVFSDVTQATLSQQVAYFSTSSIAGWYQFSVANKLMDPVAGFNAGDMIAPGVPQTASDEQTLAGSS